MKTVKYTIHISSKSIWFLINYVVIIILPQRKTVVSLIKSGTGIASYKIFNGYIDPNRKVPQHVHFRCGWVYNNNSLKKIGISYLLQPSFLKQEMDHDEIYEDTWETKNMNGYHILKRMCYQLLSFMLDIQKVWMN